MPIVFCFPVAGGDFGLPGRSASSPHIVTISKCNPDPVGSPSSLSFSKLHRVRNMGRTEVVGCFDRAGIFFPRSRSN
jgi:hypothetical protein